MVAGSENAILTGVSIDTRALEAGALYFAIQGRRFDGHEFVGQALSAGAAGAVVSRVVSPSSGGVLIEVADTSTALLQLAAHHRRVWGKRLACITGSVGKTTTKEILAELLGGMYSVRRSEGNYNNIYGLSLTLLGLEGSHDAAVVELGMNAPGEIAQLAAAAAPELGVLTNVEPVHLEFFSSLEQIAEAKGELLGALPADGTLVYNADDAHVALLAARFGGRRISYGLSLNADFAAESIVSQALEGSDFVLRAGGRMQPVRLPLMGRHNIYNFLAAAAAAHAWGIDLAELAERAGAVRAAAHRGVALRFAAGFTLIDDAYNSNPGALQRMLGQLEAMGGYERKVLVAGEMLELGSASEQFHEECGGRAARLGVQLLIGVQGEARSICRGAVAAGMPAGRVHFFEDAASATDFLLGQLRRGDLVLLKGSHGVHLEKIVEKICEEYALEKAGE